MTTTENKLNLTVFIPAAGLGTRLGNSKIPKPIRSVGDAPLIYRIIEKYPKNTEFIICLGYKSDLISQVLRIIKKEFNLNIRIVKTDSWKSTHGGLTKTMIDSRRHLLKPFIFHAVDSIILDNSYLSLFNDKTNYVLTSNAKFKSKYKQFKNNKWILTKNAISNEKVYTGVAIVNDYRQFWNNFSSSKKSKNQDGEVLGFTSNNIHEFQMPKDTWIDCGIESGLQFASNKYSKHSITLERDNETIWKLNNNIYKFHISPSFIKNRIERSKKLQPFVPKAKKFSSNCYTYKFIDGDTLSKAPLETFKEFLDFINTFFYNTKNPNSLHRNSNKLDYLDFYLIKTLERIKKFKEVYPTYKCTSINGIKIKSLDELLLDLPWDLLLSPKIGRCHGDLHPDNIIYDTKKNTFKLIDWRETIADSLDAFGDMYYDLAKIKHGLIVDHERVFNNEFKVFKINKKVQISINFNKKKMQWLKEFNRYICLNNLDLKKVDIMTGLIYLNIAPLHHDPYSKFLFYLGHLILDQLDKNNTIDNIQDLLHKSDE